MNKGVPTKDWWNKRRQVLIENKMPAMMRKMYNESLTKGKRWSQEYREFWCLEKEFSFKESSNG
jgi:hypothetical protein